MKTRKIFAVALIAIVLVMSCAFSFDVRNGDSVTLFSNNVIAAGDIVSGDAVTVFGNLEIRGAVRGDVVAVFGNVDIYGEAGGDVVAVFGNITVHKSAVVSGDAIGVFGNIEREEGSIVRGESIGTRGGFGFKGFDLAPGMSFGSVIGTAILYGLSCLVIVILPERLRFMAQASQFNIGRHLGIGFLVLLVLILLIPILIITIIGILPAILLILGFVVVALVSNTAIYIALGRKIAAAVEGKNAVYIHLLIGLVVVQALGMIPFIGWLAPAAVFFAGLGVAFDTRLGKPVVKKNAL